MTQFNLLFDVPVKLRTNRTHFEDPNSNAKFETGRDKIRPPSSRKREHKRLTSATYHYKTLEMFGKLENNRNKSGSGVSINM